MDYSLPQPHPSAEASASATGQSSTPAMTPAINGFLKEKINNGGERGERQPGCFMGARVLL